MLTTKKLTAASQDVADDIRLLSYQLKTKRSKILKMINDANQLGMNHHEKLADLKNQVSSLTARIKAK